MTKGERSPEPPLYLTSGQKKSYTRGWLSGYSGTQRVTRETRIEHEGRIHGEYVRRLDSICSVED